VDEARGHVERAEFDAALGVLEALERRGSLPRRDVLDALELHALVQLALGRRSAAEQTLQTLAILSPAHRFSPSTSPDLVTTFAYARQKAPPPLQLELSHAPTAAGQRLVARVIDQGKLVQKVVMWVRVNSAPPRRVSGVTTVVSLSPGDHVEFGAVATGAFGVLLESAPSRFEMPGKKATPISPWWYAAGATVAVAATIAGVLLLSSGSDETQPSPPTLEAR